MWHAEDGDGDLLTFEFYIGRDPDHMELVGETTKTSFDYAPDDNANLLWNVIPRDYRIRGWCDGGPWAFRTDIVYPVEVDLILPANNSIVPGPDVKLVWYGRDRDFERIVYNVYLEHDGIPTRVAKGWDDPAGPVLIVPDLIHGDTYRWWVDGDNPYSPKGVSERWTFRVATSGTPVALLHEEEVTPSSVTLHWSPSFAGPTPETYDVHLVDGTHGNRVVLEGTTLTSLVLDDMVEDTVYHWYVVPRDAQGREGYSEPTFRTFTFDVNSPPVVTIPEPMVQVAAGDVELLWTGIDPDEDQIYYDLYLDPQNGTVLIATNLTATRYTVNLEPDRIYRWRVVPRDLLGVGNSSTGVIITEAEGSTVGATGHLVSPEDGADVAGPVVNLTWDAVDALDRTLLYDLYVDTDGGNPLAGEPTTVNATSKWWTMELDDTVTKVSWGVSVRPLRGPLNVVTFNASGSWSPSGGGLEYWFDYGDGKASGWLSEPMAAHTYLKGGTYNASLVVRDASNRTSDPSVVVVEVGPGELGSSESVPGLGPVWAAIALLASSLMADGHRARRRRSDRRGAW